MKILALDLSLTNAGVCRLTDVHTGQPRYQTETVIVPPLRVPSRVCKNGVQTFKNAPRVGVLRLAWWKNWLVEEIADGVDLVVMEAPALRGSGLVVEIGKQVGIMELTCHERGVLLVQVDIKTIKKYATGLGDCDKQRMIDTAVEAFGEGVCGEHEADGAWLGRIAWDVFGEGSPDTPYRAAVAARLGGAGK